MNNTCTKVRSLSCIFFHHGQLIRLIITLFRQWTVQPWGRSLLWGSFTDSLWCLVCGKRQGVLGYPLCVNWQILRTLELPVCLFVPVELINLQRFMIPRLGQLTENYGETFVTIYRDFIVPRLCLNFETLIEHYKPFLVLIYRYTVLLWFNLERFIIRRFTYGQLWCPICH